jgi:hypothetical protein
MVRVTWERRDLVARRHDRFLEREEDGPMRSLLYKVARFLGDVNAVKKGRVGRRIGRRVVGRVAGRGMRRLFK